ncbi:MAG: M90 family metallopeptidase, partial [Planctomycetota bacterium]|nr:M90 family metallopeptidase [Planctomycetota bacterium]
RGPVVLSWCDVMRGAADPRDGRNVAFHEFAHQLDYEEGDANGAPPLPDQSRYAAWARVLGAEFETLRADLEHHRQTILDPYAATNPAEFFAVATELFFERPRAMRRTHPDLYDQLAAFYRQDPAAHEQATTAAPSPAC